MNVICAVRRRLDDGERDGGVALLLVMFVILVLATMSLLMLGAITSRMVPTAAAGKRQVTLDAAEAGVQAGLGALRNSVSTDPTDASQLTGDRNLLPCWTSQTGSMSGSVSAADANARYATTIQYFMTNPASQTDAWRTANQMPCTPGSGPTTGPPSYALPQYALITGDGIAPAIDGSAQLGNRRMEAVYSFAISNANIVGGYISLSNACFDAGSKPYQAGRQVTLTTCDSGRYSQMWSDLSNYTVELSETTGYPGGGLCLQMDSTTASSRTAIPVRLAACDSTKAEQRWGFDGTKGIYARPTNTYTDGRWCLKNSGGLLMAGPRVSNASACPGFGASPEIGSGATGTSSIDRSDVDGKPLQWVNYQDFGRCMDVTDWIFKSSSYSSGGRPSEIVYPCKQDPMRDSGIADAQPEWNQVFTWSSSTKLFHADANVRTDGSVPPGATGAWKSSYPDWCMKSPNASGKTAYVHFDSACDQTQPAFQWTVTRDTGDAATSFTIVDGFGRCLAAGPGNPTYPAPTSAWSSMVTMDCDGSAAQKWNAPPIISDVAVSNVRERTIP